MQGHQPDLDAVRLQLVQRVVDAGLAHLIEIRLTQGRPEAALDGGTAELVLRLSGRYEEAEAVAALQAAGDWTGYVDRVIEAFTAHG